MQRLSASPAIRLKVARDLTKATPCQGEQRFVPPYSLSHQLSPVRLVPSTVQSCPLAVPGRIPSVWLILATHEEFEESVVLYVLQLCGKWSREERRKLIKSLN